MNPATQLCSALLALASDTRLYELAWLDEAGETGPLLVEAFAADERLQGIGRREVLVLAPNGAVAVEHLLLRRAALQVSLPDGGRVAFSGYVSDVRLLGRHGRLLRYSLCLRSWLWRLTQSRNCRVWQERSVAEIVDDVLSTHRPLARWRWSDEVWDFLAGVPQRVYCCQYRESDFAFITRLLDEEGLGWRFEDDEEGQCMVLFADSRRKDAVPRDASCARADGIRFHRAHVGEAHDTVQAAYVERRMTPSSCSVLTWDYEAKRSFAGSAETRLPGPRPIHVEQFDHPGHYVFASPGEAQHYAALRMQAHDVRAWRWTLRSTVRTMRAGTWFTLHDGPYRQHGEPELAVERVCSVGFNNLSETASSGVEALFGAADAMLAELFDGIEPEETAAAIAQARSTGYANCIEAFDANLTWRPLADAATCARPTAHGSQSAIVIGQEGVRATDGDVYCDGLARVRISFHWQGPDEANTCWVRVAQRSTGAGMGSQFLPRIGQEVMVQFFENDIDRPVIVGALYNGYGEGAIAPTPGGKQVTEIDEKVFGKADDHSRAGQGNLAGGHAPVWHGASPDHAGHRNGAAQWGIRSKEFGIEGGWAGYNQLLFDDTDAQGRVQLKCTHAGTELTLGHLIHNADNYRGSFRGTGIELRTNDYGCVRAEAGILISSYAIDHGSRQRDPAGHNPQGVSLAKAAVQLADSFSKAAVFHQTVGLACMLGTDQPGTSVIDDEAAPLPALHKVLAGMVGTESVDTALALETGRADVPHTTAPIIAITAQAGLGVTAGQDVQLCNGETATLMSGRDTQFVTGGQMRVHTGQAIGMLGGAVKSGEDGLGLQMIAAQGAIDVQAQSDEMRIQARDDVNVISANAHIDWAAAKKVSLSTAGGANITIEGGNITVQCPGKITIYAGTKSFIGPARIDYPLPRFPSGELCMDCLIKALRAGSPLAMIQA